MRLLPVFLFSYSLCTGQDNAIVDVFVRKTEGYKNYRIPSLIAAKSGTLLAFAEGRMNLLDHADSSMAVLPNGRIGVLFEKDGYETISFMTVGLDEVLDPDQKQDILSAFAWRPVCCNGPTCGTKQAQHFLVLQTVYSSASISLYARSVEHDDAGNTHDQR
jgi:hypothetical protein